MLFKGVRYRNNLFRPTGFFGNKYVDEQRNAYNEMKNEEWPSSTEPEQIQSIGQFNRRQKQLNNNTVTDDTVTGE